MCVGTNRPRVIDKDQNARFVFRMSFGVLSNKQPSGTTTPKKKKKINDVTSFPALFK